MKKVVFYTSLSGFLTFTTPFANLQKAPKKVEFEKTAAMQKKTCPPLTLEEALKRAFERSVIIDAAGARRDASKLQQTAAIASSWLPRADLSGSLGHSLNDNNQIQGNTTKRLNININYNLLDGFESSSRVANATSQSDQANVGFGSARDSVLTTTIQAYLNVMTARSSIDVVETHLDSARRILKRAQTEYKLGQKTKTDVLVAEAKLAEAEAQLIAEKSRLIQANQLFTRFVGEAPNKLTKPTFKIQLPDSKKEALDLALKNNSKVIEKLIGDGKAGTDMIRAAGAFSPKLGAGLKYEKSAVHINENAGNLNDKPWQKSVSLDLSMNLFNGGADMLGLASAAAGKTAARLDLANARQEVEQDLVKAWAEYDAAKATVAQRRSEEKARSRRFEALQNEERLGKKSFFELVEAQNEYLRSKLASVQAEQDVTVKGVKLLDVIGLLDHAHLGIKIPEIKK